MVKVFGGSNTSKEDDESLNEDSIDINDSEEFPEEESESPDDILMEDIDIVSSPEYLAETNQVNEKDEIMAVLIDSLTDSSMCKKFGLNGDLLQSMVYDTCSSIIDDLRDNGLIIVSNEKVNTVASPEINMNAVSATLREIVDKESNYLINFLNDVFKTLELPHEALFNHFMPVKEGFERQYLKLEEEENKLVLISKVLNKKKTFGMSVFSLISTITNLLYNKRLTFQIDDATGIIVGVQWLKTDKIQEIKDKLKVHVGSDDLNIVNISKNLQTSALAKILLDTLNQE